MRRGRPCKQTRLWAAPIATMAAILALTGCMSLKGTFFGPDEDLVFKGTRDILDCYRQDCRRYGKLALLLDLPLSAVMDALLLPYTMHESNRRQTDNSRPVLVEIPETFEGWVVVQYEDLSCDPLSVTDSFRVLKVPRAGRVCTSSALPADYVKYKFEGVSDDGQTRHVYLDETDDGMMFRPKPGPFKILGRYRAKIAPKTIFPRDRFFVGTQEEYVKQINKTPTLRDKIQAETK